MNLKNQQQKNEWLQLFNISQPDLNGNHNILP